MARSVRISVEARPGEARCPYCHQELPADEREACGGCATPYHAECLRELGRCALPGCLVPVSRRARRRERERRRRAGRAAVRVTGRPGEQTGPGEQAREEQEPLPVSCVVYAAVWGVYLLVAALVFPAYLSSDLPTLLRALEFFQGMKWVGLGLVGLFPLVVWLMSREARRGGR